jgi:hypothetical protein
MEEIDFIFGDGGTQPRKAKKEKDGLKKCEVIQFEIWCNEHLLCSKSPRQTGRCVP